MTTTFHPAGTDTSTPAPPAPGVPGVVVASSDAAGERPARWDLELALAALTMAAVLGLHRVFVGTRWVGPVIGCALGVQLVCLLTRRWVHHPALGGLIDLAAVGLLTVWTVAPSSTTFGLPLGESLRAVRAALSGVVARMTAASVPAAPETGFLLLSVAGAGVVALAGSWLAFRLRRTLTATLPSFAAFVVCCCLGARTGRSWSVALEVIAVPGFVLVEQVGTSASAAWFAARRSDATRRTYRAAVPGIVIALVVALAIVPSVAEADGGGPLGWRSDQSNSPRIVISPLVSLSTRLLQESGTDVFTVRSAVPSYWRLTSLDYFDGTDWNAHDTYQDVDRRLPGVTRAPKGTRVVSEHFDIQGLDSVWLPLAFDPESVTGAGKVAYDSQSGSLLTPRATSDHLTYTVTSLQYLDTLSARDLSRAPAVRRSATLASYLQLPASVPASVRNLARRITAGSTTEYAKAYALQEFFYGPSFTYSLRPPSDGSGTGALETFLFQTRTGYCQQFAGSYAVLARSIGLPTRLATGFTTGRPVKGGYQVTDADAHTWPEVWFPSIGWVPFEPTKGTAGAGFAIPGATAYTGNTAAPRRSTGVSPAAATSTTTASTLPSPTPKGAAKSSAGAALPHGAKTTTGSAPITSGPTAPVELVTVHHGHRLAVVAAVLVALVVLGASNELVRRVRWALRRRRALRRTGPGGDYLPTAVIVRWEEVAERLAWQGVRRRAAETPRQFAERVAAQRRIDEELPLGSHLRRLADLLAAADFAATAVPPEAVQEADRRGRLIAAVLYRGRGRRERLALWLNPRLAWSPATVEPAPSAWHDIATG